MSQKAQQTPMLKQYFSIKAQYPDTILLYRVGDFYECYSDDAELISKLLGIVLTRRSNGDTAMAGFPHHAIDSFLHKLVRAGYKVAICDQLEDPALTKSKLVKRGVTEILTPGIAFSDAMLEQKEHNYLAGLCFDGKDCGVAFLDVSTGTFQVAQGSIDYISTLLSSMQAKELLVQKDVLKQARERFGSYYISTLDEWAWVYEAAVEKLKSQLKVQSLKGYGVDAFPLAICSAGALLVYLEQTQHSSLSHICSLSRIDEARFVWMDQFTIRNLELFRGGEGKSLLETLDRTCSPMGARLLRSYIAMPLIDIKAIEERQDIVQLLTKRRDILQSLQQAISGTGDLERIISRLATGKILPREMLQLARSLRSSSPILSLCSNTGVSALDKLLHAMRDTKKAMELIECSIKDDTAAQIGKGEVISSGVSSELDELRSISHGGKQALLAIQQREIERTGIGSLKIGYNSVFGYYIEVRNSSRDMVPPEWTRKQTLVGAERYITSELKQYEEKVLSAEASILAIETRIYGELISTLQQHIKDIKTNCAVISALDVLQSFAQQALDRNYCRPVIDKSNVLSIKAGRHPVIETLMAAGEEYVANDLYMDSSSQQIIILTGPNMSGKSALLRQTALIVLMAQMGSFVPAEEAQIGYFDKIFTRVGASDNISRGESTFMVEMLETSMIMHNLSARSLVLLDEIGRGTSTYDGMSIARALVEYLHTREKGAKTLFATHYHELNDLEGIYKRVKNYHIAVQESGQDIIFLRKLLPGGVAHSFGIHVARLAGMPREVVESAEKTLRELELRSKQANSIDIEDDGSMQLSLFQLDDPTLSSIRAKLDRADINNMTPLQAFDLLRAMKEELGV